MKVETTLIQRAINGQDPATEEQVKERRWDLRDEIQSWGRLFSNRYRDRTMVGILVMVFQRESLFLLNLIRY